MSTTTNTITAARVGRRVASDAQKARREARIDNLMGALGEELEGGRPRSPRALALARALSAHHDAMRNHIASRLEREFESSEVDEITEAVANFDCDKEPYAWQQVERVHVDRVARRALAIGRLLWETTLAPPSAVAA